MAVVLCGVPEPNFTLDKENLSAGCPSVDIVQTQSQNRKSRALGEEREGQQNPGAGGRRRNRGEREPRGGNPGAQWVLHFFSALLVWAHGGGKGRPGSWDTQLRPAATRECRPRAEAARVSHIQEK